jgi:hypothetical protein
MAKPTPMARQARPKPEMPTNQPGSGMPNIDPPPTPTGADALAWKLPKGWTEARAGGMRFATLKPSTPGKVDVSVVMLPGAAGGELPNVNRWRGQIGLPPVDEASRAQLRKEVKSKAGAYAIQGIAGSFVTDLRGSFTNVVGLPLAEVLADLRALEALPGYPPPAFGVLV